MVDITGGIFDEAEWKCATALVGLQCKCVASLLPVIVGRIKALCGAL
jgi:hypothetical protein